MPVWQEKVPRVAGKGKDLILRKHKHEGKKSAKIDWQKGKLKTAKLNSNY